MFICYGCGEIFKEEEAGFVECKEGDLEYTLHACPKCKSKDIDTIE